MEAALSQQRIALAIAASAAGIAAAWLTKTPFGLLAPMAAFFLFARGRTILLLHAASAVGLAAALLVAAFDGGAARDLAMAWAAFFAVALSVGIIVAAGASASPRADAVRAMRIIKSMPAFTWAASADGRITDVSANMFSYAGEPAGHSGLFHNLDNAGWRRMVHPDDYERVLERRRDALRTGAPYDTEHRLRRRDGAYRWFRSFGRAPRDGRGQIVGWYGTMIDIDEQKQAEAALRDRERELSQLVDMVPSHLWRLTPDGEPMFFNKRMVDFLGLNVADTDRPGMSRLDAVIETVHPDDAAAFGGTLRHCLVTGESFAARYRLRRADGVYRWMSSRAEPMRDEGGRIVQWYGLCHDIDDQVRADEALRRSERQLQQLIDTVPAIIWCMTPEGIPSYLNKQHTDLIGVPLKDLIGTDGSRRLSLAHPDDQETLNQELGRAIKAGESFVGRYRQRRANGPHRWVESRAEPLRDDSGNIIQWYGVNIDIHDLVTAQETLRARERELSQLVDVVPSLLWRLGPDGEPTFFNKRMVDFLGLGVEDCDKPGMGRLAATVDTVIHADDTARVTEALNHSFATGESYSLKYRLRRADGVYRWVEGRAEPMRDESGRIVEWYGLCHDIDDQMRAEEAIRQSERRLQQMIDAVPVNILSFSATGEPTYINKRYQDYLGLSAPHFDSLREQQRAIIHPEDFAENYRTLSNCFQTGAPFLMRYRRRGKDGLYRWTEGRAEPLRDQDGAIVQWYAVSLDIEDEVRAQEALRESERSARQLVETLPAMVYCATPKGEPTYRSRQLREYLGFDVGDKVTEGSRLTGTLDAVIHPDELAAVKENYAHSLATGEPYLLRHRMRRVDGEYRWVETRAAAMRHAEGAIVQWNGICLDIEDQVRAQEKLRTAQETLARASQAASLAELSASIAHEVNQPLAAVVFNSHACHRWLSAEPANVERAKVTVERIIRDANAAADVVSRIRALFKQSVETRDATTLAGVIAEARNLMAEEAARRRVRMDVDVESNLPLVALDRVQVQQVLINLIRNGMDAMASVAGDRVLGMRVRRMGDVVRTEISDRGPGVELPDKIFEPFFTTKEDGMGMGLAICRSIVESHGGRLWTERNEPQGARFIFTLPVEVKTAT